MVGPLYRDPRPAAQLLISSAAHQSLVHDHRLVKSRPPYRRNLATLGFESYLSLRGEGDVCFATSSYVLYVGLTECTKVYRETFYVFLFVPSFPPSRLFHRSSRFCSLPLFFPLISSILLASFSSLFFARIYIYVFVGEISLDIEESFAILSEHLNSFSSFLRSLSYSHSPLRAVG